MKTPIPDRNDPGPDTTLSMTRASDDLFYTLNQKMAKVPKAMAILRRKEVGKCGLEGWRMIALELGK